MKFALIIVVSLCIILLQSIKFEIQNEKERCLGDEVNANVLVSGKYQVTAQANSKFEVSIKDSRNANLYSQVNKDSGEFSFSTDEYDIFKICFKHTSSDSNHNSRIVFVDVKFGSETKDYKQMAELEKLKPLDIKLRMIQDLSKDIVDNFDQLAVQERKMSQTNESTHSRILFLSIFSILCVVGLATWQVLYLKKYFRARKLID